MEGSRGNRMVQMALAKAKIVHEAFAEYDAKGETPAPSVVLEGIKDRLASVSTDDYVETSNVCENTKKSFDQDYVPSCYGQLGELYESDSYSSSSEDVPLIKYAKEKKYMKLSTSQPDLLPDSIIAGTSGIPNEGQTVTTLEVFLEKIDESATNMIDTVITDPTSNTDNNIELVNEPIGKKRKRSILQGEKQQRDRQKHPLRERCNLKCKLNCLEITEDERKIIWDEFWCLQYSKRRQWLCRHVRICQVRRRTVQPKTIENSTSEKENEELADESQKKSCRTFLKNESREFFLPKPSLEYKQVKVCRKMFLNTLGYTNDSVITELSHAIKNTKVGEGIGENRGRSAPASKVDRQIIINHIESFGPSLSHYRRYNSPNCRYLARDLTVQIMHKDFLTKYKDYCKVETYRNTLKAMNISFKMPKGDRCADCLLYESAIEDAKKETKPIDTDLLAKKEMHELKASQAKTLYNSDKTRTQSIGERIYSMDLQKVILLPMMPHIKDSFFISRLVVYNETYATLNPSYSYNSVAVLWHEALQGRNADCIVDTMYTIISTDPEATSFIFWADNCTSQNKNWILYSSLVHIVNQQAGPEEVTIRYLTKGHTHMSADSVHGNIEKAMRASGSIENFDELVRVVQRSRKKLHVEKQEIFRDWKSKKRANRIKGMKNTTEEPDVSTNVLLLHDIVEAKFIKGKRQVLYKTNFESDHKEFDFLQRKFVPTQQLPPIKHAYRGLNMAKKAKIINDLVPKIKNINHRAFWLNLPESENSRDLNNVVE